MYKMKDEFKIGIDFIDVQYKKFFDIVDDVYNLLKNEFIIDKYDKVV